MCPIFQALLGRTREDLLGVLEEDLPRHTIHSVPVYGQDKYLVLEDVDVKTAGDTLLTSSSMASASSSCDVVCLVYDASNPRSFEFVAKIYLVSHTLLLRAYTFQKANLMVHEDSTAVLDKL